MAGQKNAAPVIIKRKKAVAGGGHHGGAWKVAYADFVTAMMAFFMLMWLLNVYVQIWQNLLIISLWLVVPQRTERMRFLNCIKEIQTLILF